MYKKGLSHLRTPTRSIHMRVSDLISNYESSGVIYRQLTYLQLIKEFFLILISLFNASTLTVTI